MRDLWTWRRLACLARIGLLGEDWSTWRVFSLLGDAASNLTPKTSLGGPT